MSYSAFTPFEFGAFVGYGLLLGDFGPHAWPWADEEQAWMLLRHNGVIPLLFHYLRHEAHPALWYFLLPHLLRNHACAPR